MSDKANRRNDGFRHGGGYNSVRITRTGTSTPATLQWLTPVVAAVVFGGWASFVNVGHGAENALRVGMAQGAYALFSTGIVGWTVQAAWLRFAGISFRRMLSFAAAFIVMIGIPIAVHVAIRTPEILASIVPGGVCGSGYIGLRLLLLQRSDQTGQAPSSGKITS